MHNNRQNGRLPATTRIGGVRLAVSNLDRSVAYYRQAIGLQLLTQEGNSAELGAPGNAKPLLTLEEQPGVQPLGSRRRLGLYHFALLLPSRAALGSFAAHLRQNDIPAGSADHLVSEALYLTDPDGIAVEVYADRNRSEWQFTEGRLHMAIRPLDLESLLEAGSTTKWTDVPAATTIGHIHFYVDNLAQAADFYRTALGFDEVGGPLPGAIFLSAGGYHHHVGVNTWAMPAPFANTEVARLLDWQLVVPAQEDFLAASRRLIQAGFLPAHGLRHDLLFSDPAGNTLSLTTE